jgi:hypothetical protein
MVIFLEQKSVLLLSSKKGKCSNETQRALRAVSTRGRSSTNFWAGGTTCLSGGKREDNWGNKKIAIISAYEHTKLKLTVFTLLGRPQNTIKSHLVFTALFCFAPFSVLSSRMSAPSCFMTCDFTCDSVRRECIGRFRCMLRFQIASQIVCRMGGLVISRAACRAISARRRTTAHIPLSLLHSRNTRLSKSCIFGVQIFFVRHQSLAFLAQKEWN